MRNHRSKLWKKLYDAIYDFDENGFKELVEKILSNPKSRIEWEEILFKAGDTYLTIFNHRDLAKKYYKEYLKKFGDNGKFSKQISERISLL